METYIQNLARPITLSTQTAKWELEISAGEWKWVGTDPRVELIATPFYQGESGYGRLF